MKMIKKPALILLAIATILPFEGIAKNPFKVKKDVVWATPEGHELAMDIYTPDTGKDNYPVVIIFHGGGFLINNKSIMNEMSVYLVENAEYVVCNVDYRLLVDQGNTVTLNEIVEDVFGSVLWIKEHIGEYKGDPNRLIVTGDSAGGHLASMVVLMGDQLSSSGFHAHPLGFNPSYLPEGKTAEQVAAEGGISVQAAMLSYGAFDMHASCTQGAFEKPGNFFWQMGGAKPRQIIADTLNANDHPEYYKAVSPIYNIPSASDRILPPQLFTVGSMDNLTTPKLVQAFMNKVKEAGHPTQYWEYEGRPHAFLDSGSNEYLGTSFEKDAPKALDRMITFMDEIFY